MTEELTAQDIALLDALGRLTVVDDCDYTGLFDYEEEDTE
jgi:hypothetical protein